MSRRWPVLLGALTGLAGCGADAPARPEPARLPASVPARCDVGGRPGYFVPRPPGSRLALLGCARLGTSGKRVEFSGHRDRIDGERVVSINPAYSGRGRRGSFIPAFALEPPLSRFAVRDAAQPRQAVRGYAYVIWGTTRASTARVVARSRAGRARAAVFRAGSQLAGDLREPPFGLFVVELPLAAACGTVTLRADGDAVQRLPRQARLCTRA